MNIQNAIQELQSAQTGHELLKVLDSLAGDTTATPTLEPVEF